jgi:hypothetical protein
MAAAIGTQTTSHWRHWTDWIGYVAGAWSLTYAMLGVFWTTGGAGYPFGANDPSVVSALRGLQADIGAPLIVAVGLAGAAIAALVAQSIERRSVRAMLLIAAWLHALGLTLLIPDYRALMAVAYIPIFLVGAPFDWPPTSFTRAIPWPVLNQLLCIGGGLLWGATAIAYQRRNAGACVSCGRKATAGAWTTPEAAERWGRWAVAAAVIIPTIYAVTRWAWALGVPLGVTPEFLREGQADGFLWAGAGLATVGLVGALLTLGLIARWGEVFPRWLPPLHGKRVPPGLAIVPATVVAVLVAEAGLMYNRLWLGGFFPADNPATYAPELLWPIWGAALAAATLAYHLRRRERCRSCGRG